MKWCKDGAGLHTWLDVNGYSRGFYPKPWYEPLTVLFPLAYFPGDVRNDGDKKCNVIAQTSDKCADMCVKKALIELERNPPTYSFSNRNCRDVSYKIFMDCVDK